MTNKLDADLLAILQKELVGTPTQKWFVDNGCLTLRQFANWVDELKELKVVIHDRTSDKDKPDQLANLKMAWRTAEATIAEVTSL